MGIESLEQHFEVRILDCTAWLMPQAIRTRGALAIELANLHSIRSLDGLKNILKGSSGGIAIDYVGQFSLKAILLFHYFKKNGFKLVVMDSGAHPFPDGSNIGRFSIHKVVVAIKNSYIQRSWNALLCRVALKILPDQTPDFALVAGTYWMSNNRFNNSPIIIDAHSFDYEMYLQIRSALPSRNFKYAVYLDENIEGHEDNADLGYSELVSERKFFGALNKFFSGFEALSGIPVLVAGYPSRRPDTSQHVFGGREIVYGETAELIRNATIVFAHASTSVSFAVLWRRPIVFLTSDEMNDSWYLPWIEAICSRLNSLIVNIDLGAPRQCDAEEWLKVNQVAYKRYEEIFIKSSESPEISLWSKFMKVTLEEETSK